MNQFNKHYNEELQLSSPWPIKTHLTIRKFAIKFTRHSIFVVKLQYILLFKLFFE